MLAGRRIMMFQRIKGDVHRKINVQLLGLQWSTSMIKKYLRETGKVIYKILQSNWHYCISSKTESGSTCRQYAYIMRSCLL